MKTLFPSPVYDKLKWCVLILFPALTTAYVGLSAIWGWPFAEEVAKTSAVVCAFLGTLLGISNLQYKASEQDDINGVSD